MGRILSTEKGHKDIAEEKFPRKEIGRHNWAGPQLHDYLTVLFWANP